MFAKYRECELLAPGGSQEAIKAASLAGCDAVYVGGSDFSARAFAKNLSNNELFDMIDYLHLRNQRMYLAVNTLIKSSELSKVYDYAVLMYERGVDAFIVQDLGVMSFLSDFLPDIEIHASTQMAVSGSAAINFLQKNFGIKRVVLPRELSLKQIKHIAEHTDVHLECFGHGALCYSYSGQCLMSSMICQRSGNRGQCAQSCRLPYTYEAYPSSYPLSLKELNTIQQLPEIIRSGATSLKLEGRMRSPSYVGAVTSLYRHYLDRATASLKNNTEYRVSREDIKYVEGIFNRSGFTDAYLTGSPNSKMITFQSSSASSNEDLANTVFGSADKLKPLNVDAELILNAGEKPVLRLSADLNGKPVTVYSSSATIPEIARTKGLDNQTLKRQLAKSDNEYLRLNKADIKQDTPIFMPISSLNQLRRDAYEALTKAIIRKNGFGQRKIDYSRLEKMKDAEPSAAIFQEQPFEFSAYVQSISAFHAAVSSSFLSRIYLETDELLQLSNEELKTTLNELLKELSENQSLFLALPHLYEEERNRLSEEFRDSIEQSGVSGYLIRNLEQLAVLTNKASKKILVADYMLYAMNEKSVQVLYHSGISMYTLPMELNRSELKHLSKKCDKPKKELVIFGYPIAMISKSCIKRNYNSCNNRSGFTYMTDRKNYRFGIKSNCASCYNVIYNSQKIFLTDLFHEKLKSLNVSMFRLDFTDESPAQIREILDNTNRYITNTDPKAPDFPYSRGHMNRGIL